MIYIKKFVYNKPLQIRDLAKEDIPEIIKYWHETDILFLETLGLNSSALPSKDQTRFFLSSMIDANLEKTSSLILVGDYDHQLSGYCLFNQIEFKHSCQAHLHILDSKIKTRSIAFIVFLDVIKIAFDLFGLQKIILEPPVHNININRYLQKFRLIPVKSYFRPPQGICQGFQVNRYEIQRGDLF